MGRRRADPVGFPGALPERLSVHSVGFSAVGAAVHYAAGPQPGTQAFHLALHGHESRQAVAGDRRHRRLYAGRRRAEHGFRADAHGILSDLPDL